MLLLQVSLTPSEGKRLIGMGLAISAGIMTYIIVDELIPMAHEYGSKSPKHIVSTGILGGMFFGHLVSVLFSIG